MGSEGKEEEEIVRGKKGEGDIVEQNSEEDLREGSRTSASRTVSRDIECFSWIAENVCENRTSGTTNRR